jgi:hypothetical protein
MRGVGGQRKAEAMGSGRRRGEERSSVPIFGAPLRSPEKWRILSRSLLQLIQLGRAATFEAQGHLPLTVADSLMQVN